jgi:hypothetical protein
MFNMNKNQHSRQTGSGNLLGPKALPTMFLDPSDSYFLFADLGVSIHIEHICTFFVTYFSVTIDGRDLMFGHKLHIGATNRGYNQITML